MVSESSSGNNNSYAQKQQQEQQLDEQCMQQMRQRQHSVAHTNFAWQHIGCVCHILMCAQPYLCAG